MSKSQKQSKVLRGGSLPTNKIATWGRPSKPVSPSVRGPNNGKL